MNLCSRATRLFCALAVTVAMSPMPIASATFTPVAILPPTHTQGLLSVVAAASNPANGNIIVADAGAGTVCSYTGAGALSWQRSYANVIDIDCDSSGNIYLLRSDSSSITRLNSAGNPITSVSTVVTPSNLSGMFVRSTETTTFVYVTDKYESGRKVYKINAANSDWTFKLLTSMSAPKDIVVRPSDGRIYVTDAARNQVLVMDDDGTVRSSIGTTGTGAGQFTGPAGIALTTTGKLLVADSTGRLQSFDASTSVQEGVELSTGTGAADIGAFGRFGLDASDSLYVADTLNKRAQKRQRVAQMGPPYANYSTILADCGTTPGSGNGQFFNPTALASLPDGSVWVCDPGNDRVQELSGAGSYLGQVAVADPRGVAAGGGFLYVSKANNTVAKYDEVGRTFITEWGSSGSGDGAFNNPGGVAVDAQGCVYVADESNNRVQKFLGNGDWVGTWTGFVAPTDVGVAANGHVFVYDSGGQRVIELDASGNVLDTVRSDLAGGSGGICVTDTERMFIAGPSDGSIRLAYRYPDFPGWECQNLWLVTGAGTDSTHLGDAADVALGAFGQSVWVSDRSLNRVFRCSLTESGSGYLHVNSSNSDWSNSEAETLTVVMGATQAGFKSVHVTVNGSSPTTMWAMTDSEHLGPKAYRITDEGTTTIYATAVDGFGQLYEELWTSQMGTVRIDQTLPELQVSGQDGWTTGDVELGANAGDPLSGLASLEYRWTSAFDASWWQAWEGTTTVTTETPTTYFFRARDWAGNEATQTRHVRIDKSQPFSWVHAPATSAPATVTLVSHDRAATWPMPEGSGVVSLSYRVDSGATQTVGAAETDIVLSEVGTHTIEHWATDAVGHVEQHRYAEVVVVADGGGGGGGQGDGPVVAEFQVAGGASWVNTDTLAVRSDVTGASGMRFSGNGGLTWSEWMDYNPEAVVTIPNRPDDTSEWIITVQFRDDQLRWTEASDGVGLDTHAPQMQSTNINDQQVWEGGFLITFIQGDSLSVATPMCRVDGGDPFDATSGWTVSGEGTRTIEWWCVDAAGNEELPHHSKEIVVARVATSLTLSRTPSTVTYPGSATFTATLKSSSAQALPGKSVVLERSGASTGPWTLVANMSSLTGAYQAKHAPTVKTYYRARFIGDSVHGPSTSTVTYVLVKPTVSTPSAPTSVYLKRTFSFYTLVRPKHSSGTTFKFYRYTSSGYKYYKAVGSKYATYNSTTTKAYNSTSLPYRGKWYVVAVHSDATHVAVTSAKRYITVK